jgi:hypothetical protein
MQPQHGLYPSLDDLLAPETLSALEGRAVTDVRVGPFAGPPASVSGNQFLSVETGGEHSRRYVIKRISPAWDWVMRASGDTEGREARLWQYGLLDRLPDETMHPIVACAEDGAGWAILMRDVSAALLPAVLAADIDSIDISVADADCLLDGMAALHARLWNDPTLHNPALGLCSLTRLYTTTGPRITAEVTADPDAPAGMLDIMRRIGTGWSLLESLVEPDVACLTRKLQEDPRPLEDALARYPWTLVHGDLKIANLGLLRNGRARMVVLDWQLAGRMPPAIDLAYFLGVCSPALPFSREVAIERYRQCLARRLDHEFDDDWWQPQLELCLLGQFVRQAYYYLNFAAHGTTEARRSWFRSDLTWWSERVRDGIQWL